MDALVTHLRLALQVVVFCTAIDAALATSVVDEDAGFALWQSSQVRVSTHGHIGTPPLANGAEENDGGFVDFWKTLRSFRSLVPQTVCKYSA